MRRPHFGQLFLGLPRGKLKQDLSESQIERAIADFLTFQGFEVVKIPSSGYFDMARKCFRKHTSPYVRNGIPDLLALKRGRTIWFEVKSKKGILSEAQKDFHKLLEKAGEEFHVVRSVEDVETVLKGKIT